MYLNKKLNSINYKVESKLNISDNTFFIFFFLFRYFIYKNEISKISIYLNIFKYLLSKKNIYNYYFYNYIYIFFLLNLNIIKFNFLFICNIYIFLLLEFLKKNINLLQYNLYFFFKPKKLKIYFFEDIIFRIDLLLFFRNWEYIKFFKMFKYNEYLNIHPSLFKYPYLKKFLCIYFFKLLKKKNQLQYFTKKGFLNNTQLYTIKKSLQLKKYKKFENNINFLYNKIYILKLFSLLTKFNFDILDYCIRYYSLSQFLYFIYNIWLFYYQKNDWEEIKKYKIDNIFFLFWKVNRYGFKVTEWINIYTLKYYFEYLFDYNLLNLLCLANLKKNNKIIKKYCNIFFYKIVNLVVLEYIYTLFYRFLSDLEKSRRRKFARFWLRNWIVLKRAVVFEWINISKFTHSNIYINVNYLTYSFLFLGNYQLKYNLNSNFINITNKIILDSFLFNNHLSVLHLVNLGFIKCNFKDQNLFNILIIYIYIRDFNIKLLFNNFNINNLNSNFLENKFILKKIIQKRIFGSFLKINLFSYLPKYEIYYYIYIYIFIFIYLYKYIYLYIWRQNRGLCLMSRKKSFLNNLF